MSEVVSKGEPTIIAHGTEKHQVLSGRFGQSEYGYNSSFLCLSRQLRFACRNQNRRWTIMRETR